MKKMLSVLLSVLMLTSYLPGEVFAQSTGVTPVFQTFEDLVSRGGTTFLGSPQLYTPEPRQMVLIDKPVHIENFGDLKTGDCYILKWDGQREVVSINDFWKEYDRGILDWYQLKKENRYLFELKKDVLIRNANGSERVLSKGSLIGLNEVTGTGYELVSGYIRSDLSATQILQQAPSFTKEELKAFVQMKHFSKKDAFSQYAYVHAVKAKGGESVLSHKGRESYIDRLANRGERIITTPEGESYILNAQQFAKKYQVAEDLGKDMYKSIEQVQHFAVPWQTIKVDGQVIKKGSAINITDLSHMVALSNDEFFAGYRSTEELYHLYSSDIRRILEGIRNTMTKKSRRYSEQMLKRVVILFDHGEALGIKLVGKDNVEITGKAIAKQGAERAKKIGTRVVIGALIGLGIYAALTFLSMPKANAANVSFTPKSEIIAQIAEEANNFEHQDAVQQLVNFVNPNYMPLVIRDAEKLNQMGVYTGTLQATELSAEELGGLVAEPYLEALEAEESEMAAKARVLHGIINPWDMNPVF